MRTLLTTIVLASALGAQTTTFNLSYPQDTTATGSGNIVPFGGSTSGSIDEGRFQQLIPARHLPSTGSAFFGMEVFTIPGTGTMSYSSLKITYSLTTASTLSTTFASNLPNPQVVFSQTNHSINWSSRQWVPITFSTPLIYDGTSNLVIDIQKVLPATPTSLFSHGTEGRSDLPSPRYDFGGAGSGAAQSTTARFSASNVLKVRFMAATPTLFLESAPGGSNNNTFAIGTTFDVNVEEVPNSLYGIVLGSWGTGTPFPPLQGTLWLAAPQTVEIGLIPAGGRATRTLQIPNDPTLVGLQAALQGGTLDANQGQLRWTCAADLIVEN